jgi:hypothetical protein
MSVINTDLYLTPCLEVLKYQKTLHSCIEYLSVFPLHTQYDRGMVHYLSSKAGRNIYRYIYGAIVFILDYTRIFFCRNILGVQSQ